MNLHPDKKVAYTCNSCTDTDSKGEPQCVAWCPEGALQYVTTETLAQKARQKIVTQLLEAHETSKENNQ
jgi:Fe-S-cluster-containing hydrogenase component 2